MKVQVRLMPLLFLLSLFFIFASLGKWQLARKLEKEDLIRRFEQAPETSLELALKEGTDFARVRILGTYETDWHILHDNKIWQGRPGVHVYTVFRSSLGIHLLVDRGWLPMGADRRSLPEIETPASEQLISGLLVRPPEGGVRLGEPDTIETLEGPILVTYLDIPAISIAAELDLVPLVLKLDSNDQTGFEDRDFVPAVILPAQHQAYAFQWFALSLATIILMFTMAIRITKTHDDRTSHHNGPHDG